MIRQSGFRAFRAQLLGLPVPSDRSVSNGSRQASLRSRGFRPNVAVRPRSSSVQVEDASGTDAVTTAMPCGKLNPETSEALIVAPVVALYSPIVPLL
jgi:hypothetical protein